MSISIEYCYTRLEVSCLLQKASLLVSFLVDCLLLPLTWLTASTARPASNQFDAMRKAVRDSLQEAICGELTIATKTAEEITCAVCLSEVRSQDRVWELRNCSHVFHKGCLDKWLDHGEHLTCPLCRAPLAMAAQQRQPGLIPPSAEPSWAVERLLYLFGDDLL